MYSLNESCSPVSWYLLTPQISCLRLRVLGQFRSNRTTWDRYYKQGKLKNWFWYPWLANRRNILGRDAKTLTFRNQLSFNGVEGYDNDDCGTYWRRHNWLRRKTDQLFIIRSKHQRFKEWRSDRIKYVYVYLWAWGDRGGAWEGSSHNQ